MSIFFKRRSNVWIIRVASLGLVLVTALFYFAEKNSSSKLSCLEDLEEMTHGFSLDLYRIQTDLAYFTSLTPSVAKDKLQIDYGSLERIDQLKDRTEACHGFEDIVGNIDEFSKLWTTQTLPFFEVIRELNGSELDMKQVQLVTEKVLSYQLKTIALIEVATKNVIERFSLEKDGLSLVFAFFLFISLSISWLISFDTAVLLRQLSEIASGKKSSLDLKSSSVESQRIGTSFNELLRRVQEGKEFSVSILAALNVSILFLDTDGRVLFSNDNARSLLSMAEDGDVFNIQDIIASKQDQEFFLASLQQGLETVDKRVQIIDRAGQVKQVIASLRPVKFSFEGRQYSFILSFKDAKDSLLLLELQLRQRELIEASKMASLGQLSAGIAHEVNNPLSIIIGTTEVIKDRVAESGLTALAPMFLRIEKATTRIQEIVKGIKKFAHPSDSKGKWFSHETLFGDIEIFCRDRTTKNGVHLSIESDLRFELQADLGEVGQILVNLIHNATDAQEHTTEKWVRVRVSMVDSRLKILVSDGGAGIPANLRERIMEPFFTTKDIGKGTGLGLSISRTLAMGNGAILDLEEVLLPTTFSLTFDASRFRLT